SDNGSPKQADRNLPLRGHKLTPYEGGTRVPFIVKWPGVVTPGSLCHTPILIEDIFPTFLEFAGTPHPDGIVQAVDGVSFVPLLRGVPPPTAPRDLIWHFPHTYDQPPFSAIRRGPWKLIYHHLDRRQELFHLDNDLSETTDLAAQEPDIRRELAEHLARELRTRGALMPLDNRTGEPVPLPAP
ncbi:MAG: sulfatase-like hydrolase/transferase, partial [Verrucomicrobiae bacterium]|nr:sulfatase-like hydrolase/transferase [Verrucomicrobiae bacterium]